MKVNKPSVERVKGLVSRAPKEVYEHLRRAFATDGGEWLGIMLDRTRAPLHTGPGPNPNTTLHTRTGKLRRSLRSRVSGRNLRSLKLRLTSEGIPYARLQEFGGVVKAKNARALTIPVDDNLTRAGVARYPTAAAAKAHFGDLFPLRVKSGNTYLVARTGFGAASREAGAAGTDLKFLFLLKKSVRVRGRLGFFKTWRVRRQKREGRHQAAVSRGIRAASRRIQARG